MAEQPGTILLDGNLDFSGGQDASKTPDKVKENAYFSGINLSTEDGALGPRPGQEKLQLTFEEGRGYYDNNGRFFTYESLYYGGKFQAVIPYSVGREFYIIHIISGIIFIINQTTLNVQVIGILDGSTLDENAPRIQWSPAGRFLVIYDYPAPPVILEGFIARRSNLAAYEVPVSVLGAYNQNRLFIANAGNEFTGGDASGNGATPDAPITFEEVLGPAAAYGGQVFQLPTNFNNDEITGMAFLQYTDTSTGIGPLLVSTARGVFSYQTQIPRADWEAGTFGTNFIYDVGFAGPRAITNVNSDLFFLGSDGQVRSVSMSRDEQKKWSKVPLSREVRNWLKYWDKDLISYGALAYYRNKIFITANPYRTSAVTSSGVFTTDVAHGGFVVIELANISSLGADSPPVWSGLWTGVRPCDIIVNNDTCFIAGKDSSNRNSIWKLTEDFTVDKDGSKERLIKSRIYTREYAFKDPFQDKEPHSLDIPFQGIKGELEATIEYKPNHASTYALWRKFEHNAPYNICKTTDPCAISGLAPHSFKEVNLGYPLEADKCDTVSNTLYKRFRKLQLKITVKAREWRIEEFIIRAISMAQNISKPSCEKLPEVSVCLDCNDDWVVEDFNKCR